MIDGVNIRHSLLNARSAVQLRSLGVIIVAWTVNDLTRVTELVRLGVDGLTTDNLAIMRLMGGEERGERRLREHRLTTSAWQEPTDHDAAEGRQQHSPSQTDVGAPEQHPHLDRNVVLGNERRYQRQHRRRRD